MTALFLALMLSLQPHFPTLDIHTLTQWSEDGLLANCPASESELACVHGKNLIFAVRVQIARNEGQPDTVDTTFVMVKHVLSEGVKAFPETAPYFQWLIDLL